MDQLCNANTQNKQGGGGISGVYHHYTNGAHPNEMNSKNPSPPPTRRTQPDGTEEAIASGPRWMVHGASLPTLIDQPGSGPERQKGEAPRFCVTLNESQIAGLIMLLL